MRSTYIDLLADYGVSGAHPGGFPLTKKILDKLPINSNTRLLDLGCGTGQTLAYIAKTYPCKVIGVDINDQMLFKAAQRFKRENIIINLVRANAMHLPFPSNTFDIALSESVTVFTTINKALNEYARVLKTGGILLLIEMTAVCPLDARELNEITSAYGVEKVPTLNEWESMFRQAGFEDIQFYDVKMEPTMKFSTFKMIYDFSPHLNILNRYRNKLRYMVYQCKI